MATPHPNLALNFVTVTLLPTPNPSPTTTPASDPGTKIVLELPTPNSWKTWTPPQKSATIAFSILAFLLLAGLLIWLYLANRKRAQKIAQLSRGPNPTTTTTTDALKSPNKRHSVTSIARGKLRERSRSRRRGGSGSGSGSKGGRRGIEGLDDVEMGPAAGAAMKSFYESGVGGEGSQVVVVGTERCRGGR